MVMVGLHPVYPFLSVARKPVRERAEGYSVVTRVLLDPAAPEEEGGFLTASQLRVTGRLVLSDVIGSPLPIASITRLCLCLSVT